MGYSTDFEGRFNVTPTMDPAMVEYLSKFAEVRHMRRDINLLKEIYPNWKQGCPGGVLGFEGEYFVGAGGFCGQDHDESIIDYNMPPSTQPGLWCQWIPTQDGNAIEWDQGEKFYHYVEWLEYLIYNFLEPNGYVLSGKVSWSGEEDEDLGKIVVENNKVSVSYAEIVYP